ncbi:hypothetical protein K1719_035689 [Acacia pycnantha]|nr:hypothetical protein K1719_035689 [Acacia pycnantha]
MDSHRRRRPPHEGTAASSPKLMKKPSSAVANGGHRAASPTPKASDALPLPLYLTNAVFFTLFFAVAYYLLHRWRDKIRNSTPLHVVTLSEIAAIVSLIASFIYLLGFFGIDFVQSFISRASHDVWDLEDDASEADAVAESRSNNHRPRRDFVIEQPVPRLMVDPDPLVSSLSSEEDEKIVQSVVDGTIPSYSLESKLGDCTRAAAIRREALQRMSGRSLQGLPLDGFDYDSILGQCCEMPVGYVQIRVGVAGPLLLDGFEYTIPMATTEGAWFATAKRAAELKFYLEDPLNFDTLSVVFNRSSRFARLQSIHCSIAGRNLYMRFTCSTGDAMGMNMVSKGVQNVLDFLQNDFPDMDIIGISGNFCSDKKPAAVNWIEGAESQLFAKQLLKKRWLRRY